MPWIRRKLRGNIVFVKADETGAPVTSEDGRTDVVYKLNSAAKVYRAHPRNLEPTGRPDNDELLPDPVPLPGATAASATLSAPPPSRSASAPIPGDAIVIWTDGACTGNPGPMGLGAVIIDGEHRVELSEYLGVGTNNIAELTAIQRALQSIKAPDRTRTVVVHSDSAYSIGLLTKNWKAKANVELVAELRALLKKFADVRFVKVKGHAGIPENERCDELATGAIANR